MKAMTSRERMIAAMRREPVDYVPCSVSFNPLQPVLRGERQWQFPWSQEATLEERICYQVEQLGLDQTVSVGVNFFRSAAGVESRVWLEGDVLHKAYTTSRGELHASVKYNQLWPHGKDIPFFSDFNVGHFVEPWIQTEADLDCYKEVRQFSADVSAEAMAGFAEGKLVAERYGLATVFHVGLGLTGAQHLCGAEPLCMMTIEQPELVDAFLEYEHQHNLRAIEISGHLDVDVMHRNGFYETADFYSPAMLERFLGARLRRETEAAHAAGALMCYTVHSGVMPMLDYLAALPMDSLFGIDIAYPGMNLPVLRDKLAPTKSLWIGPSSTHHLWNGPEATRPAVRQVFEVFDKTGLILSPGVSAHSIMPWESTLAMVDEWKTLR